MATHGKHSYDGMGVAFAKGTDLPAAVSLVQASNPVFGSPNVLFFNPPVKLDPWWDPSVSSQQLHLLGWAYAMPINYFHHSIPIPPPGGSFTAISGRNSQQERPVLSCIPHHEWMIHAAGFHEPNGSFTQNPNFPLPPGPNWHTAIWDLHLFADRVSGIPKLGILNKDGSGNPMPSGGIQSSDGFFYPSQYDQPPPV